MARGVRTHLRDDLCRLETGARPGSALLAKAESDDAGHVRRRHARARDRLVAVARPGRLDADAWRGDRVSRVRAAGRREVAEAGGRVVLVEHAVGTARRTESTGKPVVVGHRRHGERLVVVRGHVGGEVLAAVSSRDDVGDTGGDRVADGAMQRVGVGLAAVAVVRAGSAKTHVRDLDAESCGVRGDPIDAADDLCVRAAALGVDHLDRIDLRAGRDADDARPVVPRGDRPRDMRAVTVVVTRRAAADAVLSVHGVQVGMTEIHTGIDDRDVRGRGLAHGGGRRGANTPHARRCGVARFDRDCADRMQDAVRGYERDVRVGAQPGELQRGETRCETLERARVAEVAGETDTALDIIRLRVRSDARTEDDDIGLGFVGGPDETARDRKIKEKRRNPCGQEASRQGCADRTVATHRIHALPPDWRASLRSPAKSQVSGAFRGVSVASKRDALCREGFLLA